jgi:TolA-binding protein
MVTLSEPKSETFLDAMAEASRHRHHGRIEEAAEAYGRAAAEADRRVDRDEARYRQAKTLAKLDRVDEALDLLDAIAQAQPVSRRTARALFDAALLRERRGDREGALQGFRRVVLEHSRSGLAARSLWYLVKDRRDEGDDEGALALVRGLYPRLRVTPLGDDLLDFEARILLERGDREGARAAWERLVDEHPYPQGHRWADTLHRLADMAEEDEDPERAIGYLRAIVQRHETTTMVGSYTLPAMPQAQMRIARIYRHTVGDTAEAARAYRRLVRRFPRSTLRDDALVEMAEMWLEEGRRDDACEVFRRVVDEFEVGRARRRAAEHGEGSCGEARARR